MFCSVLFVFGKQRLNEVCTNRRTCYETRDTVGKCTKEHAVNVNRSLGISQDVPHLPWFVSEPALEGPFSSWKKYVDFRTKISISAPHAVIPDDFQQL